MPLTRAMIAAREQVRENNTAEQEEKDDSGPQQEVPVVAATTSPRKKARKNKNYTQKAPGRSKQSLKRILDLPPEVFNEIAIYLMPADLLSMARSNKLFRGIFMSRTSQHLWRAAISNVVGLPPCPPGLSEPQYSSLIYSKSCSACGARVLRWMDPNLRVRLCSACRDELIGESPLDNILLSLIPTSDDILPVKFNATYYLKTDYDALLQQIKDSDYAPYPDFETWNTQKLQDLRERHLEAFSLQRFLDDMELDRVNELRDIKDQRRSDIQERLLAKGWSRKDLQFPPQKRSAWDHLVCQPKPLTDRIWNNLYPKLLPLLEANRAHNEEVDRDDRRTKRLRHLHDLLGKIRTSFPPLVEVKAIFTEPKVGEGEGDASTSKSSTDPEITKIEMPFPTTAEVLTWPVIKAMTEKDTSAEDMEKTFDENRDEIDQAISNWKTKVLDDVLDVWHEGQVEESSAGGSKGSRGKPGPSKGKGRQSKGKSVERASTRSGLRKGKGRASSPGPSGHTTDVTCGTTMPRCQLTFTKLDGTTTENVDELPDGMRLLLRADTVFRSTGLSHFYPGIVPSPTFAYILGSGGSSYLGEVWKPGGIKRDDDASAVARLLLERLGLPDATHPEMLAAGSGFLCQRCSYELPGKWDDIVSHFAKENTRWKSAQEKLQAQPGSKLVFNNAHDLSPGNNKAILKILSPHAAADVTFERVSGTKYETLMTCKVCEQIGVLMSHYCHTPGAEGSALKEHLRDAHNVATAAFGVHYEPWEGAPMFFDPYEDESYYSDEELYYSDEE